MKKILSLAVLLIGLSGCGDKYITIALYIDNRTNEKFTVSFPLKRPQFECLPNTVTIFDTAEVREAKDFDCKPHITKGDVDVESESGKILKKDIYDGNNWICMHNKDGGWTLTFVITEDDLE